MLYQEETKIVQLFRLEPFEELTLQQIMRSLGKKSYNWTYLAIQKLSKKGILHTRKIGKTIVVKINLDSQEAITELIYSERTTAQQKTPSPTLQKIKQATPFFILIEHKENKWAITDNQYSKKKITEQKIPSLKILTKEEFIEQLTLPEKTAAKQLVKEHLILHGAEAYYEILQEAYKHGLK